MSRQINRIVLMEDDNLFADWIREGLKDDFGDEIKFDSIATEAKFWERFEELTTPPADVYVFDIRVRWTHVGSEATAPPPEKNDRRIAGVRCSAAIRERCPDRPAILFSVLEREDLEKLIGAEEAKRISLVPKSDGMPALVAKIREQLKFSS